MQLDLKWEYVADRVMGGVSTGGLTYGTVCERAATLLFGDVSLDNNGGFVQIASDLIPGGRAFDARDWDGIDIDLCGNGESYDIRLRTTDLTRPWQSYRVAVNAPPEWATRRLPFSAFAPNNTSAPFDPAKLRRIGVLGVGRVFQAYVAVSAVRLYRA